MSELAQAFVQLREARGLSQAEVGRQAGLDKSTVWKLEHGRAIRAPTLRQLCLEGLGLDDQAPEYKRLLALWMIEQGNAGFDPRSIGKARNTRQRQLDRLAEKMAGILRDLPAGERQAIVKALADPRARRILLAVAREMGRE